MSINLFDLHCDTILEMYRGKESLHITFDKVTKYKKYEQIFAVYSEARLSDDEAFTQFLAVADYYKKIEFPPNVTPYLAVEGANLLAGDITRMDILRKAGVKFLTLVWGDTSCIGGAHRTDLGLTEFGKETVHKCFELSIVPDISHSSEHLFWDTVNIADIYNKPIVATHSNSRAICRHSRTLTDEMFTAIVNRSGVVGISLVRSHLSDTDICTIDTLISHIEHFMSLVVKDTVCLGCDFDGCDELPDDIENVGDMYKLYDRLLTMNYSQELADNIFYNNAKNFILRNE